MADEPSKTNAARPSAGKAGVAEMLTPSEVESLRQDKREANAYFKKAFAKLRPMTK